MAFEPNGIASVLHWSLRCGSVFGVEVRLHWSLLLLTAVQALQAISAGLPWHWLPVLLLIPFFSVLLHEFGHVTAARLTGGSADRIVMWMFGGLAFCAVPPSPGRQFFVAAAGPAVTFALAAIGIIVVAQGLMPEVGAVWSRQGELMAVVAYATSLNAGLLLFNLIPCYPLDGGKMLRCTLWPVIGLRRAALATIWIAYVILAVALAWAAWTHQTGLLFLVVLGAVMVVQEHAQLRQGFDPYLGELPVEVGDTWWERRRRRAAHRRAERTAQEEAAEQDVLDRLLEKVSAHGLPALTEAERRQLQRISALQRKRSAR